MQLLVIEDDIVLSEALAEALGDEGHEAHLAAHGAVAWKLLEEGLRPDAIILDLMMPKMDGQTFRRRQMGSPRLAKIPTLVITGQPVEGGTRAALGPTPVMSKPFPLENLLAALAEITASPDRRVKTCACGRAYSLEEWRALRWVGVVDNGRDVGEELELRNCATCGSTIAWQLGLHAISVKVPRSEPPQAG